MPMVSPYAALPWAQKTELAYQQLIQRFEQERAIFERNDLVFSEILERANQFGQASEKVVSLKNRALEQALRESPYRRAQTPQQQAQRLNDLRQKSRSPRTESKSPPKQQSSSLSPSKERPIASAEGRPRSVQEQKPALSSNSNAERLVRASVEERRIRDDAEKLGDRDLPIRGKSEPGNATENVDNSRVEKKPKTKKAKSKAARDVLDQMSWSEWRKQIVREQDGTAELEHNLKNSPWGPFLPQIHAIDSGKQPSPAPAERPASTLPLQATQKVQAAAAAQRASTPQPIVEAYGSLPHLRRQKVKTISGNAVAPRKAKDRSAAATLEVAAAAEAAYGAVYRESPPSQRKAAGRKHRRRQAWADPDGDNAESKDKQALDDSLPRRWRADIRVGLRGCVCGGRVGLRGCARGGRVRAIERGGTEPPSSERRRRRRSSLIGKRENLNRK